MRNPFTHGPFEQPVVAHDHNNTDENKTMEAGHSSVINDKHPIDISDSSSHESFTADAQDGVKKMEATTTVWNKKSLIAAYIMWVRQRVL